MVVQQLRAGNVGFLCWLLPHRFAAHESAASEPPCSCSTWGLSGGFLRYDSPCSFCNQSLCTPCISSPACSEAETLNQADQSTPPCVSDVSCSALQHAACVSLAQTTLHGANVTRLFGARSSISARQLVCSDPSFTWRSCRVSLTDIRDLCLQEKAVQPCLVQSQTGLSGAARNIPWRT